MRSARRYCSRFILAVVAVCVVGAGPASAGPLDDAPSIRNKQMLLEGRNVIAPMFAFSFADEYVQHVMGGVSWRIFLESWLGIGANFMAGAGLDTDLTGQINTELEAVSGQPFDLATTSVSFMGDLTVEIVPFVGKFMLFRDYMARMDFHINVGFGIALVQGEGLLESSSGISLMPTLGVGVRLYPVDWISIGVDVRNHLIDRPLSVRRDGSIPASAFDSNWMTAISVGFMLPTELEILP